MTNKPLLHRIVSASLSDLGVKNEVVVSQKRSFWANKERVVPTDQGTTDLLFWKKQKIYSI